MSEKYKKYIARRNRPICEFLTSFCDAKGRENPRIGEVRVSRVARGTTSDAASRCAARSRDR